MDVRSEIITDEDWALFRETLTSNSYGDTEVQIQTVKHITSLAKGMGPQRTRDVLLSFLLKEFENFNDDILYIVSEELEYFLPLVGGPEYVTRILSILLEISKSVDENIVRNRAIESIKKLLKNPWSEDYVVTSLVNIEDDSFCFAEKYTALALIPVCYCKSSPQNRTLFRQKYLRLLDDDSCLIREVAASGLSELINNMEVENVVQEIVPISYQIANNDQESIRINAIEVCLSIAKKTESKELQKKMLDIILKSSRSSSWQLRERVALLIDQIVQTFDDEEFTSTSLNILENLVDDDHLQVRIFAARNVYNFAKNLFVNFSLLTEIDRMQSFENTFLRKFIPILLSMNSDESDEVQITLSSSLLLFSKILSNQFFEDTILPIIINGLESDKPFLFKENILKNLDYLPHNINVIDSIKSINKIIHSILMNSENCWRARRSLLVTLLHISKFCSGDFFKTNLLVYYIFLLKDNVFAVRRTSSLILPILAKRFGAKWLINEIIPHIHSLLKDGNYLYRYILLFCIQELIYPSIDKAEDNRQNYLIDIKNIPQIYHGDYVRTLCSVIRLNFKLREQLYQKSLDSIFKTYEDKYNIHGEDVKNYCEELFDIFIRYNAEVTLIQNGKLHTEKIGFLEGILILLNGEIMNVVKILIRDPISNIQDRAKYILTKIRIFSDNLNEEIEREWVKELTKSITETRWREVDLEIAKYMDDVKSFCEGVKEINTKILKSSSRSFSNASLEIIEIMEKQEVFPTDLRQRDIQIDEMDSLDEEKTNITNL